MNYCDKVVTVSLKPGVLLKYRLYSRANNDFYVSALNNCSCALR